MNAKIRYALALVGFIIFCICFLLVVSGQPLPREWKPVVALLGTAVPGLIIYKLSRAVATRGRRPSPMTLSELAVVAERLRTELYGTEGAELTHLVEPRWRLQLQLRPSQDDPGASATLPRPVTLTTDYFNALKPGRLLISGPGGSGKTSLLVGLSVDILKPSSPIQRLPVRFSLETYDPEQEFDSWLAHSLHESHRYIDVGTARQLIGADLVLPLLDGLDEMDQQEHATYTRPALAAEGAGRSLRRHKLPSEAPVEVAPLAERFPRASKAIGKLDSVTRGSQLGPMVITCRSDDYYRPLLEGLRQVAGIRTLAVEPLSSSQMLTAISKTKDPRRWQAVEESLTVNPHGPLAGSLSRPLRLTMALSLFDVEGSPAIANKIQPRDLVSGQIDLVSAYATEMLRRSGSVERRLLKLALPTIAAYLVANIGTARAIGGRRLPEQDIVVHQLWPIAGTKIPRLLTAVLCFALWVPAAAAAAWVIYRESWMPVPGVLVAIALIAAFCVSMAESRSLWPHPRTLMPHRLRTPHGATRLIANLLMGAILAAILPTLGTEGFAVAFGAGFGITAGLLMALAIRNTANLWTLLVCGGLVGFVLALVAEPPFGHLGAAAGMTAGVCVGGLAVVVAGKVALSASSAVPDYVANPVRRLFIRQDFLTGVILGGFSGCVVAAFFWLSPALRVGHASAGLIGLSVSVSIGLGLIAGAWRRYCAMLICMHGKLPVPLEWTLERAYRAQLLRYAGIAYQFRHIELRDYFADSAVRQRIPDGLAIDRAQSQ